MSQSIINVEDIAVNKGGEDPRRLESMRQGIHRTKSCNCERYYKEVWETKLIQGCRKDFPGNVTFE